MKKTLVEVQTGKAKLMKMAPSMARQSGIGRNQLLKVKIRMTKMKTSVKRETFMLSMEKEE